MHLHKKACKKKETGNAHLWMALRIASSVYLTAIPAKAPLHRTSLTISFWKKKLLWSSLPLTPKFSSSSWVSLFFVLVSAGDFKRCPLQSARQNQTKQFHEVFDAAGRPMLEEKFECLGGYSLHGHRKRTCTAGDSRGWSARRPTCVRTSKWECKLPPPAPQTLARAFFFNSLLHHYHAQISTSDLSLWVLRKIIRKKSDLSQWFVLQFSFLPWQA